MTPSGSTVGLDARRRVERLGVPQLAAGRRRRSSTKLTVRRPPSKSAPAPARSAARSASTRPPISGVGAMPTAKTRNWSPSDATRSPPQTDLRRRAACGPKLATNASTAASGSAGSVTLVARRRGRARAGPCAGAARSSIGRRAHRVHDRAERAHRREQRVGLLGVAEDDRLRRARRTCRAGAAAGRRCPGTRIGARDGRGRLRAAAAPSRPRRWTTSCARSSGNHRWPAWIGPGSKSSNSMRGDDPEGAAAAAQRAEQVGVLAAVGADVLAVGGDELDREHAARGGAVAAAVEGERRRRACSRRRRRPGRSRAGAARPCSAAGATTSCHCAPASTRATRLAASISTPRMRWVRDQDGVGQVAERTARRGRCPAR